MISIRYGAPDCGAPSASGTSPESSNPGLKPWAEIWSPFREEICTASLMLTRMGVACLHGSFCTFSETRSCALGAEALSY